MSRPKLTLMTYPLTVSIGLRPPDGIVTKDIEWHCSRKNTS